jgi:ParB family transcriptional regulator, chromosome partitioning protein
MEPFVVLDLDPGLLAPSFMPDRMEPTDESYRALRASIAAKGQIAPILVRPHPDEPGRYQVACGHRRVRAAADLGRSVRCILRPLGDRELVIAQGQENSARANLSFIERARFAQALQERRYGRDTIMLALSIDKSTVSRLLAVCRRLPLDIIEAVGPAPAAGRERWMRLARAYAKRALERPVDPLLEREDFIAAPSDQRFAMLYEHLAGAAPLPRLDAELRRREFRFGLTTATATVTDRVFTLRTHRALGRPFGAFLLSRLDQLYEEYAFGVRKSPSIRHTLGR